MAKIIAGNIKIDLTNLCGGKAAFKLFAGEIKLKLRDSTKAKIETQKKNLLNLLLLPNTKINAMVKIGMVSVVNDLGET